MDPFSITAGCVGLLQVIVEVSAKLYQFSRTIREKQDEIVMLQREIVSFERSVSRLRDGDLAKECPEEMTPDLCKIISESRTVMEELSTMIERMLPSGLVNKIQWAVSDKNEVTRVRQSLESHKAAINIAISAASMSVACSIKRDTNSMRLKVRRIPELEQQIDELMSLMHNLLEFQHSRQNLSPAVRRYLRETESFAQTVMESETDDEEESATFMKEIEAHRLPPSPARTISSQAPTVVSDQASTSSHSSEKYQHRGAPGDHKVFLPPKRTFSEQLPIRPLYEYRTQSETQMDGLRLSSPLRSVDSVSSQQKSKDFADHIGSNPAPPIVRKFNAMSTLDRSHTTSSDVSTQEDWSEANLKAIADYLCLLVALGRGVVEFWIATRQTHDLRNPPPYLKRMRHLENQILAFKSNADLIPMHRERGSCAPPLPSSNDLDVSKLGDCAYAREVLYSKVQYTSSLGPSSDPDGTHGQESRLQVLAITATIAQMMLHHGNSLRVLEGDSFPDLLRIGLYKSASFGAKISRWPEEEVKLYDMAIRLGYLPALLGMARLLLIRNQKSGRYQAAQCLRAWEISMNGHKFWNEDASLRNDWAWKAKYDPIGDAFKGKSAKVRRTSWWGS